MKKYCLIIMGTILFLNGNAQLLKRLGDNLKNKMESKTNEKVNQAVDKTVDGTGNKPSSTDNNKNSNDKKNTNTNADNNNTNTDTDNNTQNSFQTYSKFDFVSGEKVVAYEDFSQDAIGDFPDKWNTNANGELVNIGGKQGKWLNLGKDGVFMPEFINAIPDNFTLEFDVACSKDFSYYSSYLNVGIAAMKNPSKDFTYWKQFNNENCNGILVGLHPKNAGGSQGITQYHIYNNGAESMKNETDQKQFHANTRLISHVSIWRQKQRLRVYVNEEKIWDVPRAFDAQTKYNSLIFQTASFWNERDKYYIGNLRLAVGAPDTRNKLISEGKFVTSGILFDLNSAAIKPESNGILKEIGTALQENSDVKIKITGHTSSDGDASANMELSKKRAESVKQFLQKNYNITADRMETDGKGASMPIDKGNTAEARANNRRVEFVKI